MAETDPFGRDKGEDPLAEMGWSASQSLDPGDGPAEVAIPETPDRAARRAQQPGPQAPAGVPTQFRRRSNRGCAFAVVVVGFIIAVFAVVVPAVITAIDEAEEEIGRVLPTVPTPAERQGEPPRGLGRASLLRRENLAPALRRLERVTRAGRVQLVRVDATAVIVTAALGGGRTRVARADWQGGANVLATTPAGGGQPTFGWSRIDPAAPARIARFATRGRRSSAFDYVVLTRSQGIGLGWTGFLRGGGGPFRASPDGRDVTRIG